MKLFIVFLSFTLLSVPVTALAEGGSNRVIARAQAQRDESMARFLERQDAKAIVSAQQAAKARLAARIAGSAAIERSVDQP
ncbi:co-regulatory protein PtrA N-terminal domain-containing protein [Pseudomonas sp. MWU13-2105]|uniref:co-regulatory protein PtrA N-terminal domain-containing protein n=1 Tax=Pseudomonas sp. MWU13-2105 TaxID=2935074 RepID=UPI00200E54D3|nr:co-regulatory protein PtrA N-terminal domain-containing protein [Pseudomonas sp. MWU13-2105]